MKQPRPHRPEPQPPRRPGWRCWLGLVLIVIAAPAWSAVYTVTSTADSGPGSLRQAMLDALATPAPDEIVFVADGVILLQSALPELLASGGDLTITGNGAAQTIIDGGGQHRLLHAREQSNWHLTLRALTLRNGSSGTELRGGAVLMQGGSNAALTVDGVEFVDNYATQHGAAIFARASMHIENSLFVGSQVSGTFLGSALTCDNAPLFMRNTVIADGRPSPTGKAHSSVFFDGPGCTARLVNSSVIDSIAISGIHAQNAVMSLSNTLLATAHQDAITTHGSGAVDLPSSLNNLVSTGGGTGGLADGVNGNQVTSAPALLAPLGDHGGPVRSRPLLPGSPALDAGTTAGGDIPAVDARGMARVGAVDIGPYESRGFLLQAPAFDPRTTLVGTAFAPHFPFQVVALDPAEQVEGGIVQVIVPDSGPSATVLPIYQEIDAAGQASLLLHANAVAGGPYVVRFTTHSSAGGGPLPEVQLDNRAIQCGAHGGIYTLAGADNHARISNLIEAMHCNNQDGQPATIDLDGQTLVFESGPYQSPVTDPEFNALPPVAQTLELRNGELHRNPLALESFRLVEVVEYRGLTLDGVTLANGVGIFGGALNATWPDSLQIFNSRFVDNSASFGGAIYVVMTGSPEIANSQFTGNQASRRGGAVRMDAHDPSIHGSRFENNYAVQTGGGVDRTGGSRAALRDNVFIGNAAGESGGAMRALRVDVSTSVFEGNHAPLGGALHLIDNQSDHSRLDSNVFARNSAEDFPVLYAIRASQVHVDNATIVGNSATVGSSLFGIDPAITDPVDTHLRNSIVWNNPGMSGGDVLIERSLVEGGDPAGLHIIDADPQFVDAGADNWRLAANSPAIDAGDNAFVIVDALDIDGHPRRLDDPAVVDTGAGSAPVVDLGAYERQGDPVIELSINDVSHNEGNAGTTSFIFTVSLSLPAPAGGVSFDIATADGTAVAPGDYVVNSLTGQTIPAGGSTYSFTVLVNGDTTPEADETFFVNVSNVANAVVVDGQGQGTIVNDDAGPCASFTFPYTLAAADNAARVAELRQAIECANGNGSADEIDLAGYTLLFADGPYAGAAGDNALPLISSEVGLKNGALERADGAPVFRFLQAAANAELLLDGVQLRNGASSDAGGAILSDADILILRNVALEDNRAANRGGGLYVNSGTAMLGNIRFTGNTAPAGAAISHESTVFLFNARIENNGDADTLSLLHGNTLIAVINTLIAGNHLSAAGSSLFDHDTSGSGRPELRSVTIADNAVAGKLFQASDDNIIAHNAIIWDNQYASPGDVSVQFAILQDAPPGIPYVSNLAPGFVDAPNDYRLDSGSPGIDAGNAGYSFFDMLDLDDNGVTDEWLPDLDLNPRRYDDANVADTGESNDGLPMIDLGAWERQTDSLDADIIVDAASNLQTTEAGGTATFSIVLQRYPADSVTLALSSSDPGEGVVAPASIVFTQANWNRPHLVTVMGMPDGVVDGDQTYQIDIAPAVSADAAYDGMSLPSVSVLNIDIDTPVSPGTVGGTVIGLDGSGLVLALNDDELLPISGSGTFTFLTALPPGTEYAVTVDTQPSTPAQHCVVINGSGTMGAASIGNVVVNCGASSTYAVGGTASGLTGSGLTLQLNGAGDFVVTGNGSYAFAQRLADGASYVVTISQQPQDQWCVLANPVGSVQGADVVDVDVACTTAQAQLHLDIDDGHAYTRYGQVRDYLVTLANSGNSAATGVQVSADFSDAFDTAHVQWLCLPSSGGQCGGSSGGGFIGTAHVPPGSSVTWIVSAPVLVGSNEAQATFAVAHDAPQAAARGSTAVDTNTLVITRDGFNQPYGDGAADAGAATPLHDEDIVVLDWIDAGDEGIDTLASFTVPGAQVQVQRLYLDGLHFARLLLVDTLGQARSSGFVPVTAGARLGISHVRGDDAQVAAWVLLEGAAQPLAVPIVLADDEETGR